MTDDLINESTEVDGPSTRAVGDLAHEEGDAPALPEGTLSRRWWPIGPATTEVALAALSAVLCGLLVVVAMRHVLAAPLSVRTGIVGYPIFADFNGSRYLTVWYLAVVAWPLLTLFLFLALRWLVRKAGGIASRTAATDVVQSHAVSVDADGTSAVDVTLTGRVGAAGRVVAVGLVWGFAGAIVRDNQGFRFWRDLVLIAVTYVVLLLVVTGVLFRLRRRLPRVLSGASSISLTNAVGAVLTIVGLVAVSESTVLVTVSDGVSHPMHWLPLPLGVAGTVVLLGAVAVGTWRARAGGLDRVRTIERRALFLVSVPVVIFLSTAVLTGGMGPLAVFESGQQVATLRLLHLGEFPWRDFLMFHGLFTDTFIPAVGYRLLDPSAWGALAGIALIVTPLTWITMYLFAYRVVGVSWAAIVAVVLLFFNTTLGFNGFSLSFGGGQRFLLWPLVLILLAVTLDRGSRWAALCLGGALVAFAILLPEGSYALPAIGVVIVAHDAYHARWPRIRWMRDFTVSLSSIAGGIIVASTVLIILAANHAVGSFIDYYVTLVPGHDLEGALPIPFTVFSPSAGPLTFWILAPGVAVLFVAVYLAVRVRLRRALRTNHFLLMATGLFVILYYQEFTGRADMPHLAFLYDTTLPLLLLCGWELGGLLNGWLCSCLREVPSWVRGSHAGTIRWPFWYLLVAASALTTSTSVPTLAASAPANFRASAPAEPWLPSLGYMDYGSEAVYSDLGHFLNAFLPAGAEIYDFSNEPGVYFYILDYRPATPHFAAVDDISQGSQDETVAELRAHPPAFVVIAGSAYNGMTSWDGIVNAVREYDIAQYLLDEYRPFADVDGELIYANRTLHPQIPSSLASQLGPALTTADLPFQYPTCNWGDVPEFLDVPPPAGGSMTVVGGAATPSDEWSLSEPPGGSWSAYQWIQFTIAPGSPAAALTLRDRDVPGQQHDIAFQTLAGGETSYQFPIGACPQWHGYSLPALQLTSSVPMMITQVRLLP